MDEDTSEFQKITTIDVSDQDVAKMYILGQLLVNFDGIVGLRFIDPFQNSPNIHSITFGVPSDGYIQKISTMIDGYSYFVQIESGLSRVDLQGIVINQSCFDGNCQSCIANLDETKCTCLDVGPRGVCICEKGYYYNTSVNQCLKCNYYCGECRDDTAKCTTCPENSHRILNSQTQKCDCEDTYMDNNSYQICYICHFSCDTCNGPDQDQCLTCNTNQHLNRSDSQLINSTCVCDEGYFYFDSYTGCKLCHSSCVTCSEETYNDCLLCKSDLYYVRSDQTLNSSSCICKTGYYEQSNTCIEDFCDTGCQTCDIGTRKCLLCKSGYIQDTSTSRCNILICESGYYNVNDKCIEDHCDSNCINCNQTDRTCRECKSDMEIDSNSKKCVPQKIQIQPTYEIEKSTVYQSMQKTVVGSAIVAVSAPTLNISKQFLTIQKLNFLVLINIVYNEWIYMFMESIRGTNPLDQLQNINFLSKNWFYESQSHINNQKLTLKVGQTSIIFNAGGVFTTILICTAMALPLLFVQQRDISQITTLQPREQTKGEKIQNLYITIASKIITQLNEIVSQIAFFSIFLQIINMKDSSWHIYFFEFKIIIMIIFSLYSIVLYFLYYQILNNPTNFTKNTSENIPKTYQQTFFQIILNENIESNFKTRNFKLIQMLIENILIPFSIVIFYQQYLVQTSLCAGFQLVLTFLSILYRPSQSLLNNIQVIIDQICWTAIFTALIILGYQTENLFSHQEEKDVILPIINNISWFLMVLFLIILFLSPVMSIIKLISMIPSLIQKVKELLQKRKQDQIKEQEQNLLKDGEVFDLSSFKVFTVKTVNMSKIQNGQDSMINRSQKQLLAQNQINEPQNDKQLNEEI